MTGSNTLTELIVAIIEEMKASYKNRQKAIKACREIEAETTKKLY